MRLLEGRVQSKKRWDGCIYLSLNSILESNVESRREGVL
jgi:hypothetical protein